MYHRLCLFTSTMLQLNHICFTQEEKSVMIQLSCQPIGRITMFTYENSGKMADILDIRLKKLLDVGFSC